MAIYLLSCPIVIQFCTKLIVSDYIWVKKPNASQNGWAQIKLRPFYSLITTLSKAAKRHFLSGLTMLDILIESTHRHWFALN